MADLIGDAELRFVTASGLEIASQVREHTIASIGHVQPVRLPPSHAGQRHYPGLYWARTTRDHVVYESLLERDRTLLADFDPHVSWIAAQPFWVAGKHDGSRRRHCPDLLLTRHDGTYVVVDVKHSRVAQRAEVQAVFAWTREVCARLGADYEVWTGSDPTVIKNVRFIAQARRESRASQLRSSVEQLPLEMRIAEAEDKFAQAGIERPRHLVLELIWNGTLGIDLAQTLDRQTLLQRIEAA
ncbi:TnsA-like heteromeric transposase endonuclease subunit [Gordonia amicalis]|uniref:TnsA-like heteromeric transposase endonuclease subunit n=1 Tax=Gordonia amicalis TaxID=89053 RepID=UPI0022A6AC73|nr:TnsA-like heteromeric transposase endonuclease subunit [Gordonia amicalis]MCZ0914933.1 TnsA-like heteromeric transposase endonuclease subunit [Gordonia amicalis]